MSDVEYLIAKNYALKLLSFRPRSEQEIRIKLKSYLEKKHLSSDLLEQIISLLKGLNFINDIEFSQWWIDQRKRSSIKGAKLVRYELISKGVSRDIIEGLASNLSVEDEIIKVRNLVEKYIKKIPRSIDKRVIKSKISRYLFQRGFSSELINRAIDEYFKNDRMTIP